MPVKHHYKVIFMIRPIAEVVASQRAMTTRLGTKGANLETEQLERGLRAHREEIRRWAQNTPHVELLEIDYPTLVRDPAPAIAKLVAFLGSELVPNEEAMAAVIDSSLHRKSVTRARFANSGYEQSACVSGSAPLRGSLTTMA